MKGRKGPLVVLEYPGGQGGGMNSARYQEQVLEGALKDFYHQVSKEESGIEFQQDGAASHRSKSTMKWFHQNQISLFNHPPRSPDLSPIEPVWLELKKCLQALPYLPTTVPQLIQAVKDIWDELPISDIDNVARQDAGYKFCEVQRKGKVKGDVEECRQRAWMQTDDGFANARQET
jgi:hypothetical protein